MDYPDCIAPWEAYSSAIFNVVIGDGITRIGANAFVNVQIDEITIPQSVTEIGDYSLGYTYKDGSYEIELVNIVRNEMNEWTDAYINFTNKKQDNVQLVQKDCKLTVDGEDYEITDFIGWWYG